MNINILKEEQYKNQYEVAFDCATNINSIYDLMVEIGGFWIPINQETATQQILRSFSERTDSHIEKIMDMPSSSICDIYDLTKAIREEARTDIFEYETIRQLVDFGHELMSVMEDFILPQEMNDEIEQLKDLQAIFREAPYGEMFYAAMELQKIAEILDTWAEAVKESYRDMSKVSGQYLDAYEKMFNDVCVLIGVVREEKHR